MNRGQRARWLEILLWIGGISSASYLGVYAVEAHTAQAASFAVEQSGSNNSDNASSSSVGAEGSSGTVIMGRLEIPQLSLSVPMMSNFEPESLLRGVGHIQGTAMPGGLGTMGLAGHRDTYFRPLRRIAVGMKINVTDATGTYHYLVDSTEIVTPEQVEVLNILDEPKMTLVTCYPFDYIGAAPKRFIVHAHLLSILPDVSAGAAR